MILPSEPGVADCTNMRTNAAMPVAKNATKPRTQKVERQRARSRSSRSTMGRKVMRED